MDYFKHFGSEWFTLPTGESILMTDLTKRASLIGELTEGSTLTYTIRDGETPESIAYKLYGDSSYWWVVMAVAGKYEQSDWPTEDEFLEEEVQRAYPYTNIHSVKHYLDANGNITDLTAVRIRMRTTLSAAVLGLKPVTFYEDWVTKNEQKRMIRLLDPSLAPIFKKKLLEVMSG